MNGPVVLTAEEQAVLYEGIGLILFSWTAMRYAVENCWGGCDSQLIAEQTVSNIFDHFTKSKDGLAEILESGLDELNTEAEDGSLPIQVPKKLRDLYEECINGNYQTVEKLGVTSSHTCASVVKVSNGNNDEDEFTFISDDEDEDTCMNNDQSTDMMVDASDHCSTQKQEAMPVDEPKEDDGWTVVPCRKNKGKRN